MSKTTDILQTIRQLPAELSEEQVLQIIQTLPTLPPPKTSWIDFLTIKSITMSTISIIAIISSIWILNTPPSADDQVIEQPTSTVSFSAPNPVMEEFAEQIKPTSITEPLNEKREVQVEIAPLASRFDKEIEQLQITPEIEANLPERIDNPPVEFAVLPPVDKENSGFYQARSDQADGQPTLRKQGEPLRIQLNGQSYFSTSYAPLLLEAPVMQKLAKQIYSQLQKEGYEINREATIILSWSNKNIQLNGERIAPKQAKQFKSILKKSGISPNNSNQLALTDNYLLVGLFNSQNQFLDGMVYGNGALNLPQRFSPTLLIKKEKSTQDKKISNTITTYLSEEVSKPKNRKKNKKAKANSISIAPCDIPFPTFDDLRPLKRKLRQNISADQLVNSKKKLIRFSFLGEVLLLNGKKVPNNLQSKYLDIITDYQIAPCDSRLIEITEQYIAAGDMTADGFKGHMTGRAELDNIGKTFAPNPGSFQRSAKTEIRKLGNFHSLKIGGLARVYLDNRASDEAEVKVSGMPMEDLITTIQDGVLSITTKGNHRGENIKVMIGSNTLKSIEMTGPSELRSEAPIKADKLDISVKGVSSAWLEVDTKVVSINMLGGDLFIRGKTDRQNVRTGGRESRHGSLDNSKLEIKEEN